MNCIVKRRDSKSLRSERKLKAFIVIVFAYNDILSGAPVGATRDNISQHNNSVCVLVFNCVLVFHFSISYGHVNTVWTCT